MNSRQANKHLVLPLVKFSYKIFKKFKLKELGSNVKFVNVGKFDCERW